MFKFKLTGADSISKEYKAFNTKVYFATQAGLTAVGSELTKQLQRHIQQDVYSAYTPSSYIRRGTNGGIIDSKYMKTSVGKMSVELDYEPKGYNPRYPTSAYVDGDKLINAIENSNYTWEGTDNIPERHFWNNFIDEVVSPHGWVEKLFVRAMNETNSDLEVRRDGHISADGNDTVFAQQLSFSNIVSSNGDDLGF
ncbi:MAG: hypothetical protein J1E81_06245 [Eubacterium sp.]|nr:hypothetical protein [Eubacterium sp.]